MKCKSLKNNIISLIFLSVLSIAAAFCGFYFKDSGGSASFFFGAASGLAAAVLARTVQILIMLKHPKYRKSQEIAQNDERLKTIRNRSMAVSYTVTIIALAFVSCIFAAMGNMQRASDCSMVICLSVVIYFVSYLVLSHKE